MRPGLMQRSKDELMLLEMQNIYEIKRKGSESKAIPGGDIAEVTSMSSGNTGLRFTTNLQI